MQQICILGSTGSIGKSTLEVIAQNSHQYCVRSLVAHKSHDVMLEQISIFKPDYVVMSDSRVADQLRVSVKDCCFKTEVMGGTRAMLQVAADSEVDVVMAAIVGAAGLLPTLSAVKAGKKVLLANKEVLVMTGSLFMKSVKKSGTQLLPIDSEHNAIFQCLPHDYETGLEKIGIRRILLTASGGPFRNLPIEALSSVKPDQACAHPNWSMGKKISVDSATMMNKGLELIEACWLFGARPCQIEVIIHPQSIIHSLVDYKDGSVIAQMGNPDMRTPITHAMAWPERVKSSVQPLSLVDIGRLDFYTPCMERFRCLQLAQDAALTGGTAATILNAANEVAVQTFIRGNLRFDRIADVIDATLQALQIEYPSNIEQVLDADKCARIQALTQIERWQNT